MNKGLKTVAIIASSLVMVGGTLVTGCSSSGPHRTAGRTIDDATITAKVKTDLLRDKTMHGSSINVDTYNGNVQLNGWVNTPDQKTEAETVARGVNGVVAVQNNLSLKEAAGAGQ